MYNCAGSWQRFEFGQPAVVGASLGADRLGTSILTIKSYLHEAR